MERTVLYMYWKIPPPPVVEGGKISADGIWGEKYEKAKRKRGKVKEKGRKGKKRDKKKMGSGRPWVITSPPDQYHLKRVREKMPWMG
jgi:hypothetical protein